MNTVFSEVNKRFGFGCMRLPMKDGRVDEEEFSEMIRIFLEHGYNYFDTAHGYIGGQSETAIKNCLTSRYSRDRYILTDKLTGPYFEKEEDIRPFFESQLKACGVEYFDFYLMHAQNARVYEKFKACRAYETALSLRDEGKIRHFGISFHDSAEVLDRILTEYPQIEAVQIQFNYADYEDPMVQSRLCYEVCVKHGKPVIVMEPVKGKSLALLPPFAEKVLNDLPRTGSNAYYALRFAAHFKNVFMVLSGMSNVAQMSENVVTMDQPEPLTETEIEALKKVCAVLHAEDMIACTACRYCTDGCPMHILIPDLFAAMNSKMIFHDWNQNFYYREVLTSKNGKASDCIKCGLCELSCPQKLPVRDLLTKVAAEFEK